MPFDVQSLTVALPEAILAVAAMVLLLVGAFTKDSEVAGRRVAGLTLVAFISALVAVIAVHVPGQVLTAFPRLPNEGGIMHVLDDFAVFAKSTMLIAGCISVLLAGAYLRNNKVYRFEYYVLLVLSVLGGLIMASAFDLLMLYVGLELMSFCLYILAAFRRDEAKSSEAGLKYFVLGSLSSGLLLYGISLLYGMTGSTGFGDVQVAMSLTNVTFETNVTISLALVLVITGLAFKISAVPFHMWTPDVYEGAPTPVTAFMASVPKIAAFVLLIRVLHGPMMNLAEHWQQIMVIISMLTMALGALLAIMQDNIKRLLAYSSIAHVGIMLIGVAIGTEQGVSAVLSYLAIYSVMTLGAFGMILMFQQRGVYVEKISDLAGLANRAPRLSFLMLVFMFSLAGVPPLAGFFAKYQIFKAAVDGGFAWLAIFGVLASVVAAYYSLRVVKVMYFDEGKAPVEPFAKGTVSITTTALAIAVAGFFLFADALFVLADAAAGSLF